MGIALNTDFYNDQEAQKRAAAQTRYRTLTVVLVLTLAARLIVKNPPPPKVADHRDKPFRAIPGILNNLTPDQRARLTPTQVAMLKQADQQNTAVVENNSSANTTMLAGQPQVPFELLTDLNNGKQFQYKTREEQRWKPKLKEVQKGGKDTVVVFRRGGYLLAEEAIRSNQAVEIMMDRTMRAKLPTESVQQIIANAAHWKEPIPLGQVVLKPAKGITITVASNIAKRISVTKTVSKKDETAI